MNPLSIKVEEEAEFKKNFTFTQYKPELKKEYEPQNLFIELTVRCRGSRDAVSSQNNVSNLSN